MPIVLQIVVKGNKESKVAIKLQKQPMFKSSKITWINKYFNINKKRQ